MTNRRLFFLILTMFLEISCSENKEYVGLPLETVNNLKQFPFSGSMGGEKIQLNHSIDGYSRICLAFLDDKANTTSNLFFETRTTLQNEDITRMKNYQEIIELLGTPPKPSISGLSDRYHFYESLFWNLFKPKSENSIECYSITVSIKKNRVSGGIAVIDISFDKAVLTLKRE